MEKIGDSKPVRLAASRMTAEQLAEWQRKKDALLHDDATQGIVGPSTLFTMAALPSVTRRYALAPDDIEAVSVPVHEASLTKNEQLNVAKLKTVRRYRITKAAFERAAQSSNTLGL